MKYTLTLLSSLLLYINALAQFNEEIPDEWNGIENETEHIPRHENSFTRVGDKFYLLGGRESDIVEIYDPATKTWTEGAQAPIELNHFQATAYQGLLWAIGAFKDNNFPTEQPAEYIYVYDPVADEWIQGPEVPVSRRRGAAGLVVYNDKFYVVSGIQNGHTNGWVPWLDEYDPATNTWTELPDAPQARDHFHAVLVDDKIYLAGGRRSGQQNTFAPLVPEVDVYDLSLGQWLTGAELPDNIPTPRAGTAAVNFEGEVIVIGGEGTERGPAFSHTEALNVNNGQWRRLADLVNARHGTQAAVSGRGIFITSGSPTRGGGKMNNMEIYGLYEPEGNPVVAGNLSVPEGVVLENTDEISISVTNQGGNQALYISSIVLEGEDAEAFEITGNGDLSTGMFIAPGGSRSVNIRLLEMPESPKTASLVIKYGTGEEVAVPLTADQEEIPPVEPPENVSASDGEFDDKVVVSWDEISGATHYQVYRSTEDNPEAASPVSDWITASDFEDSEVEEGQVYYYYVKAATSAEGENESGFSEGDTGFLQDPGSEDSPVITLSTDALDFGDIGIGQDSVMTVTMSSSGGADLEVSSIDLPEGFLANWESGTIEVDESVELSITFSPTEAKSYDGTIVIYSNAETGMDSIEVFAQGSLPTAIEKESISNTITIYPNPAKDEFSIRLENNLIGFVRIRVMNTVGQQIGRYELNKDAYMVEQKINSAQLPKGLYLIEVSIGQFRAIKRISKQ